MGAPSPSQRPRFATGSVRSPAKRSHSRDSTVIEGVLHYDALRSSAQQAWLRAPVAIR